MQQKDTWHIHIEGQVQGVGFRPFVYRKAIHHQISGWVNNTNNGVHCVFNATSQMAKLFYDDIIINAPDLAYIVKHRMVSTKHKSFSDFSIIHSNTQQETRLLLTPDFAICADCRSELSEKIDSRYQYAFITCTNCGPRFSIIKELPYDRERTSMDSFFMCENCLSEYGDPLNRRYYSQTNSCHSCPVKLTLVNKNGPLDLVSSEQIINKTVNLWQQGKIVAIKGVGGYLLTCDATKTDVISTLRSRKRRPSKPFAVMYPDVENLLADIPLKSVEIIMIQSRVAPILLLPIPDDFKSALCLEMIAPRLNRVGVMIPYTPLYNLLLERFNLPIVATSGNITNAPIVFEDAKKEELFDIADYILDNNRDIVIPQDDSVITYSPLHTQKILLRRSRGLAPTFIQPNIEWPSKTMLAMGAMMKSSFALLHQHNTFLSQYLGDLDHFDTQENFRKTIQHFLNLFNTTPAKILVDRHPNYPSSRYGQELAQKYNIETFPVQHHKAHFASVLGEHSLLEEKVLGVIWDGIGLGDDDQIWGGEFFMFSNKRFSRVQHLQYFPYLMGDKMSREPRLSALSFCCNLVQANPLLKKKFTKVEWDIYQSTLKKTSTLRTSSVGRLFDAVASLLNLVDKSTFEGQAAMLLEDLARKYFTQTGTAKIIGYPVPQVEDKVIPIDPMIHHILTDISGQKSKEYIAARFILSLVDIVAHMANQLDVHKIAFSGGVFQNTLLVDLLIDRLGEDFQLYFHCELSPNDENIAFGQLVYYCIHLSN